MLSLVFFGVQGDVLVKAQSSLDIIFPTNSTYNPGSLAISVRSNGLGASNIYYSMTYSVDGKGNVSIPLLTKFDEKLFQVVDVTGSSIMPELPGGPHNMTVYEKVQWDTTPPHTFLDNATVYFTIDDRKPPIITNLSPENKTYSQNNLLLNFTIDEPTSRIGYCLDGQANVTIATNTMLTELAYKEHNITVYAQDLAGNIGSSETIHFSISQPETMPKAFSTATIALGIGASVAVICVGALVYFKKRKMGN